MEKYVKGFVQYMKEERYDLDLYHIIFERTATLVVQFTVMSIDVLKKKVKSCSDNKFDEVFGKEEGHSSPLNAKIGSYACVAVQQDVLSSNQLEVSWKTTDMDKITRTVGCIKIFIHKSQTSPFARTLKYFPIQVRFLKISKERRRELLLSEKIVSAYLSTQF